MLSRHIAILMVAFALCRVAIAATSAEANHILVDSEDRCNAIKVQILDSPDQFEAVIFPAPIMLEFKTFAKSDRYTADFFSRCILLYRNPTCPSGKSGGSLGSFGPGQMVREFDEVIFKTGTVGKVISFCVDRF